MLIRSGEALAIGWSRNMLYSGFNILPRSVVRRQTGFAARITRTLSRSTMKRHSTQNPYQSPSVRNEPQRKRRAHSLLTYHLLALLALTFIVALVSLSRVFASPIPTMYISEFAIGIVGWFLLARLTWRRVLNERRKHFNA